MLKEGDKAPDFKLKNHENKDISLSDFKGKKIVLYFYPKDNTPGCTQEACGFRNIYDLILAKNSVVLGISSDSVISHEKFKNKYNLPFHLLSDPTKSVIKMYECYGEKKCGAKATFGILRKTYLIDENQIIFKIFPKVTPKEHAKEILDLL